MVTQKICAISLYPVLIYCYYGLYDNPYADRLFWVKPQTDEERMKLKRNWYGSAWTRDWEIDQYEVEPPMYDTWTRRQKYPEYYGDKYNGFKRFESMY